MEIALLRNYKGEVTLHVNGHPASAAKFNGMSTMPDGTQHAVFIVPLSSVTLGEVDNVIPFPTKQPVPVVFVGDPPATS